MGTITAALGKRTFKDILDANRGIGPGFDLIRVALAVAIFWGHAKWLAHGNAEAPGTAAALLVGGWEGWKRPILTSFVPAFFALSGFLVTGSAVRTRVTSTFLAFRVLRIFPALSVELALSAFVLGGFLTTLPLLRYFSDPQFFRYFGNLIGWITYYLPGVFMQNPAPGIMNASLWTLPSEFDCYAITAALMVSGVLYNRKTITIAFLMISTVFVTLNFFTNFGVTPSTEAGFTITYYFFVGVIFYHWREIIPHKLSLFLLSALGTYILKMGHHTVFMAPIFLTYSILFLGLAKLPKIPLINTGDYSYGIYLYGFPITQAVVLLVPGARGNGWLTLGVGLAITCIFAALSWHIIEKPTLALKRKLPARLFPKSKAPITPTTADAASRA